ncbi:Hypp3171 [Branchiostoma lanceolatum]|uniref:Hypp3171 protein n=1 Tax=Branchiostoma lanceolatum TaxID=7740 RepID=A0A8K0ETE3_BRALA|nr:Hypp3171 [Branchiostoma lanceolatum]
MAFLQRSVLLVVVAMLLTVNLADSKWFRFRTRREPPSLQRRPARSRRQSAGHAGGNVSVVFLAWSAAFVALVRFQWIEKQQKQINELETGNKLLEVRVDLQADKIKNLEKNRDFLQDIKDEIMDLAQDVGDLKKDNDNLKNTEDSQNEDIVALQKELAGLADCYSGGSGDTEVNN